MPIGPFPDFDSCVAHMTKPKDEGGGGYDEETAKKVCGKMKVELEESFSWTGDIEKMGPLLRGKAIHPIKIYHPDEWPHLRVYLEEELEKSADSMVGKPLYLDHWYEFPGSRVLGAKYEDGALEYVADPGREAERIFDMIRRGESKHVSVQFDWKILEQVNGLAPRGINYQHLSLLKDMMPGDPASTVEIWKSIAKELKEAKREGGTSFANETRDLAPPNPHGSETEKKEESKLSEQIIEPSIEDRVKGLEESISNLYSRIAEVENVLNAKIETLLTLVPHVESKTKEAEWTAEYVNNLDDDCFAYIEPGGEKGNQGKTTPRSLRHFPYKNAEGNLSPDHVRNGLARLGQELGDWATADAKAQIKKKLCAAAKELEIESEVCDLEECKETIEALKGQVKTLEAEKTALQEELKKKPVSEAIISSSVTQPGDILREIKRLLPERPPMAWGHHYHQLWRNLRNIVKRHS